MQTTCAVLTPRAVWCRARATAGLTKLCQLLALSAWHGIAQERSAGSSGKQISALRIEISDQNFLVIKLQPTARAYRIIPLCTRGRSICLPRPPMGQAPRRPR